MTSTDTLIIAVVDESGSMSPFVKDTIGGFDEFIKEQAKIPGGRLTLTTFSSQARTHQVGSDLDAFLGQGGLGSFYAIQGNTALLDAVGQSIKASEDWINTNAYTGRVVVVVLTDGQENASRTWHMNHPPRDGDDRDLGHLIKHKQQDGWEFVFLGSGGSDWLEKTFGDVVDRTRFYATEHSAVGTHRTYAGTSSALASSRVGGQSFGAGDIDVNNPDVVQSDDESKGPVH